MAEKNLDLSSVLSMDINSYRHQYDGKDASISFFAQNDLENWGFQQYEKHFGKGHNPPSKKTMMSSYKQSLNRIQEHPKTPTNVKAQIKVLLKKVKSDMG